MAEVIKLFEHPDYKEGASEWEEIRDFYDGKHGVLTNSRYLVKHQLENAPNGGAMIRQIRENISGYTNFLSTVVSSYLSLMFRYPIDTSAVTGIFGEHIDNVDGQGTSLQTFVRDHIAKHLILYGKPLVRTDTFAIDAVSRGAEQELGQRPIWSMIHPLDAKDWQFKQTELSMFRHEYKQVEERSSLLEEPKVNLYSRIYQVNGSSVDVYILRAENTNATSSEAAKWQLIQPTQIAIPEIPIAGAFNAKTWVRDVTTEQRRHWNLSSDLDNIVHYQAYAVRVAKGIEDNNQKLALSEYTVIFLPRDGDLTQLEPVYPQALIERLAECQRNLFAVAFNMARAPGQDSNAVEGANTIRERKDDIVAFLESQVEVIENVANKAIEHWALMSGKSPAKIKLSRKITTRDIDQLIMLFQAMGDELANYPIWKKRTLSEIAQAQGLGDDAEVKQEIENTQPKQRQEQQQRPGGGLLELIRGKSQGSGNQTNQGARRRRSGLFPRVASIPLKRIAPHNA